MILFISFTFEKLNQSIIDQTVPLIDEHSLIVMIAGKRKEKKNTILKNICTM